MAHISGPVSESVLPPAVSGTVCLMPQGWQRVSHSGDFSSAVFLGRGKRESPWGARGGGLHCQPAGLCPSKLRQKPARVVVLKAGS